MKDTDNQCLRLRDHLYAAFAPLQAEHKHALYQWSLPEGARHVPDYAASKCMAGCNRSFGLLGISSFFAFFPVEWLIFTIASWQSHGDIVVDAAGRFALKTLYRSMASTRDIVLHAESLWL